MVRWQGACLILGAAVIVMAGCDGTRPSAHGVRVTPTIEPSPGTSERCTVRGQHAVDIYSAMLQSQSHELRFSDTTYIVDATVDGPPEASRQGPKFTADVARCIALGLGHFGHVTLVSSTGDPRIPMRKSGGPLGVVKDGFVVTFGQVPPDGGRTQVSINTGGGFGFRGGEYCVGQTPGAKVAVLPCGSSWIS